MPFDAIAAPLTLVAVALPFVFSYTEPPLSNCWPLTAAWTCIALLAALAALRARALRAGRMAPVSVPSGAAFLATQLALGLLLAAVLASGIGLVQYFGWDAGLAPWVSSSSPGQAIGNLRQRNQQASLLTLGVWALLWLVAQIQVPMQARTASLKVAGAVGAWHLWLAGLLIPWALAWLALGSAATASRTGALQWLLIAVLLGLWRRSTGRLALGLALIGLLLYGVAAWLLPGLLLQSAGFQADALFVRFLGDPQDCTSRRVLWANVLHLIAQKPWTGWGWGELDYAHYMTLFPGERFCTLLDNAHNLPLHLAAELGLPVALLACAAVLAGVLWARPWGETDPARQLAWGILAIVGLHSMLEFPLWYGPFQLVTLLALALLWRRLPLWWARAPVLRAGAALAWLALVGFGAYTAWDYARISQLYRPGPLRAPAYREDTLAKVADTRLFADPVNFARLTTTPLTPDNALQIHALATELLHFSPEPRVIEQLIESALLLGRDDEVAFQLQRYRIAYPDAHAQWVRGHSQPLAPHQ